MESEKLAEILQGDGSRPGSPRLQSHDHSRSTSRLELSRPTSRARADASKPPSRMLATPAPAISEEVTREAEKIPKLVQPFPPRLAVVDFIEIGFEVSAAWRSSYFNPPLPMFVPATAGHKR